MTPGFYPLWGRLRGLKSPLLQVPLRPAALLPVADDGDRHRAGEDERRGNQKESDVLRRLAAQVRVEKRLRDDAKSRCAEEVSKPQPCEPGGVGDHVEGDAGDEAADEDRVHPPPGEPAVGGL